MDKGRKRVAVTLQKLPDFSQLLWKKCGKNHAGENPEMHSF
jgi:hypothetical protein